MNQHRSEQVADLIALRRGGLPGVPAIGSDACTTRAGHWRVRLIQRDGRMADPLGPVERTTEIMISRACQPVFTALSTAERNANLSAFGRPMGADAIPLLR